MNSFIDIETYNALKEAMGADFIGELVDTYCSETPQLIHQLQDAFEKGDAETFRRSAHSIKSSSASFGALDFSAQARELEMIGKAGDLSSAGEKVQNLVRTYDQVSQSLQELKNEP